MIDSPTRPLFQPEAAAPHASTIETVLGSFGTDLERGLTQSLVAERRAQYGFNELQESPPAPLWKKFVAQFNDFVIWILIVAASVSGLMGEWTDALAILAIVLLNAILGFSQEERAERALAALQKLSAPLAKVIREGACQAFPARELVPGDRIELEAGDNIPADARLIEAFGFRVQEAALTGESTAVDKVPACVLAATTPLGDRRNMAYLGTIAVAGKASAVVIATGMNTELGRIAGMLQRYKPEPTPLQQRLAGLGKLLASACLILVTIVFLLEWLRDGNLFDAFLISVSLAVAAVPEGLPAVMTIALALGLQRMVKRNALIRKLPSVETLGSVTVICSDKTGTLTRNEMTVREVVVAGMHYRVTGNGYEPSGEFRRFALRDESASDNDSLPGADQQAADNKVDPRAEPDLVLALTIAAVCNNARLRARDDNTGTWEVLGDPTEGALLVAARKGGVSIESPDRKLERFEIPFNSERRAMSVVLRGADGMARMYTKGAPEALLPKCNTERRSGEIQPFTAARRHAFLDAAAGMADRALRVLALAYRDCGAEEQDDYQEEDLIFVGFVGMIDPPRDEAHAAVRTCRSAGIRPVMITGDHPATALAIARELGIAAASDQALTGPELDRLDDAELASRVEQIRVYARVTAEHKLRIVRAWKGRGHLVAMTGDGVNDAPAVKAADIGIAMGIAGSDVTKEASDMVLTDDNFASIVAAVEEGRGIYDNLQKVLTYLLSCNSGEILFMLAAGLLGWPAPLMPVQLLWINLVTDGLPALALALEPPEPGIMRRRPRLARAALLPPSLGMMLLFQGALIGLAALAAFGVIYRADPDEVQRARTICFSVLVYAQLFAALVARSKTLLLPQLGLFTNPHLLGAVAISALLQLSVVSLPFIRPIFESVPHRIGDVPLLFALAVAPATVIEAVKWARVTWFRSNHHDEQ